MTPGSSAAGTRAPTSCVPAAGKSVNASEARPAASVTPLVAPSGKSQTTPVPATGAPAESRTSTTSGWGRSVPTVPDCPSPDTIVICVGRCVAVATNDAGEPVRPAAVARSP